MGCKGPMKGDPFCVDRHGVEILTTDIISKKHFLKVNWCCIYRSGESFETDIWSFVFAFLDSLGDAKICDWASEGWQGGFQCHRVTKVWQAVTLCVKRNLWCKRNRTFDGVERPTFVIKEFLLRSLYDWMTHSLIWVPSPYNHAITTKTKF